MRNIFVLILTLFLSINIVAQEVCESPDEIDQDLNSISVTKCTIKESKNKRNKKSRQISVTVSANRRHLKKREISRKKEVTKFKGVGVGIAEVQHASKNKIQELALEKTVSSKINIAEINSKLSVEELKKAAKFTSVDKIPLFNACKKVNKNKRADCFNENMIHHISKHFQYPSGAIQESIQGEVWVRFIIDKNGEVKNIKTLAPKNGDLLSKEAIRVVSKLPQFIPAKKDGGRVSVKYGFPISFALEQ
ncbi:energy transducer TonB [Tenacibaculum piscium]|uniref:energy transducer TonB n=1 Tax=Tenacibaculum piscium TaxID=1458515 RepID=UPI001EFA80C6|nr:energy transducer TonB [Tenacibaculum piscium]MCG8182995.1 energy transducer TonB [Tenacibaculum piscium]MCG8204387.1 energy transducer TonB [Tenacibaculum piscium]